MLDIEIEVFAGERFTLTYAPEGHYTVVEAPRVDRAWRAMLSDYMEVWPLRVNEADYHWLHRQCFASETFRLQ